VVRIHKKNCNGSNLDGLTEGHTILPYPARQGRNPLTVCEGKCLCLSARAHKTILRVQFLLGSLHGAHTIHPRRTK